MAPSTAQSVEEHRIRNFVAALNYGIGTTGFTEQRIALEAKMNTEKLKRILTGVYLPNEFEMIALAKVMDGMSPDMLIATWKHSDQYKKSVKR